ncbi:hypothetical protein JNUCC42_03555 [Brevibacterium sp. JNUCC-42]|nr:hypothetical protein JNUCC42_03555 [Brevibacterium sp. JNUCC-42]
MFKKLVVGALATGIALTGGIGATSASTENPVSSKVICNVPYGQKDGKFVRTVFHPDGVYAHTFTQNVCGSIVTWYLKHVQDGVAEYEGVVTG